MSIKTPGVPGGGIQGRRSTVLRVSSSMKKRGAAGTEETTQAYEDQDTETAPFSYDRMQ